MKYAFMTFSTPELSLADVLATAAKFGYDGVEPRIDAKHNHGIEVDTSTSQREQIRATVGKSDVALACIATSLRYADVAAKQQMIDDTHARIDLTADVGCSTIRAFGGMFPDSVSRLDAIAAVAECLKAVADHAAERNVTICMETHDAWCNPDHLAAVIKDVNHPNIQVNWDIMHPIRRGEVTMTAAFETLKPWIKHVHFHDGVETYEGMKLAPIGTGRIDHKTAVELLQENAYDGYLSGEWIGWSDGYETHLPRELATMKSYEK